MRTLAFLLSACAFAACNPYDPNLGGRPFKCGTSEPRCPDGYTCVGTGTSAVCELNGTPDAHAPAIDGSHVQCGTDTSIEPNDDIAHALQTPVRNQQADYTLAKLALCPSTDVDMFGFNTTSVGQNVRVTLTYDPGNGALNMKLLTRQGQPAGFDGQPSGNTVVIVTNRLSVDQWYVQVSAASGVENNYDLDINVSP
ncbi:MAG TPA: hypothetical protein VL463_17410 [Kofleriaceae bacterium]|nr:hypothetical protein [Kofleriaceae bacterium]